MSNAEHDKAFYTPNSTYSANSFRGNHNHMVPGKEYGSGKIISPRLILPSAEKSDRDGDLKGKALKPRLLTGKLPSAFDVNYKR